MANIRAKRSFKKEREKKKKRVKELPLFKRGCRGGIQKKRKKKLRENSL